MCLTKQEVKTFESGWGAFVKFSSDSDIRLTGRIV